MSNKTNIQFIRKEYALHYQILTIFTPKEAQNLFQNLSSFRYPRKMVFNRFQKKEYPVPRGQRAYHKYPNAKMFYGKNRTVESVLFPEWVTKLVNLINKRFGSNFNTVLFNDYKNGKDYINYHHDDMYNWKKGSGVLSLTLGATRKFLLRLDKTLKKQGTKTIIPKEHQRLIELSGIKEEFTLYPKSGEALIISQQSNKYWEHKIPKEKGKGRRISLTLREIDENDTNYPIKKRKTKTKKTKTTKKLIKQRYGYFISRYRPVTPQEAPKFTWDCNNGRGMIGAKNCTVLCNYGNQEVQLNIPGINVNFPWSQMIINRKKVIETRPYKLNNKALFKGENFFNTPIAIIETPGKLGAKAKYKIKTKIIGIIQFSKEKVYSDDETWKKDKDFHLCNFDIQGNTNCKIEKIYEQVQRYTAYEWRRIGLKRHQHPFPCLADTSNRKKRKQN